MPARRLYILLASSCLGVLLLIGLGVWQLQRLEWKNALLADLEQALSGTAPALDLSEAEDLMRREPSRDYLRVALEGKFDHSQERFLFWVSNREIGWRVITPLITDDRRIVLVDRGFVPASLKEPEQRSESLVPGTIDVPGLLKRPKAQSLFLPRNRPQENIWYALDVAAMLASMKLPSGASPSAYVVEALPKPGPPAWPRPLPLDPKAIPNNHLQYALTWFALAVVLTVMTGLLLHRNRAP